ncbi:hypothetical protein HBI56_194110 [Parastagonospora nodorum]|nr:hypothetical protein HBH53_189720 [Parastagonospora nodorum]KAH3993004.1 hypothetical protein HBI10_207500 [Parastagonospora nodorum]KAH4010882.1 hypothetical protein HBI13_203970 [Parastagonospora nodorum]KAH4059845.1 hypothetical protein HBH49_024920 [Parastagonospora nodorum]KAH4251817.1 hypothetical protein HBI03_219760 [Parastagonospora nodorum]
MTDHSALASVQICHSFCAIRQYSANNDRREIVHGRVTLKMTEVTITCTKKCPRFVTCISMNNCCHAIDLSMGQIILHST